MWGTIIALILAKDAIDGVNRKDLPREQQVATNQDFLRFLGWFFLGLFVFAIGGYDQRGFRTDDPPHLSGFDGAQRRSVEH